MKLFAWKDPSSWPNFLGKEFVEDRPIEEELVDEFFAVYTHIRVYHASRPIDPESIRKDGLRTANYERLLEEFKSNLNRFCGIVLRDEQISYAKNEIGTFHNKRLFVVLNDEDLLNHAGHYAIYGSEYLVGIANRVREKYGIDCLQGLKKFGKPTVFEIDLPIEMLSEDDVSFLVREINNYVWANEIGDHVDFTFELHQEVPSSYIVNYYHPDNISDPLDRQNMYSYAKV